MNTLFDTGPVIPEGFIYTPSFINEDEELFLSNTISKLELTNMIFHEYEAKRKVMNFGKGWSFTEQCLKKGDDIPSDFNFLSERIANHLSIDKGSIAQLLVTEYPIGAVINWHRDAPPYATIAGVSLLSDCIFKLRPYKKEKQLRNATISMPVQRRSLYTMNGIAKTDWQHCTSPGSSVRYSLTFRSLR